MPWGKLDDTAYDNPKLGAVSLPAVALYFLAISYCNRHLTDGLVTTRALPQLRGTRRLAAELVREGLWATDPKGFVVHDFLRYNESKAAVESRREAERIKKARQREAGSGASTNGAGGRFEPRGESRHVSPDASPRDSRRESPATRPGPSRRERDTGSPTSGATPARTGSARRDVDEARLTREQLKAWESYADPAWQPFKAAWIARGFLWPPSGDATDDEEASERARLWHLVNPADGGRSKSVGQWVQAAPKGADAYAVIGFVFARFNELRGELLGSAEADADFGAGPSKEEATEALGSLMGRVAAHVPGPATPEVVKT